MPNITTNHAITYTNTNLTISSTNDCCSLSLNSWVLFITANTNFHIDIDLSFKQLQRSLTLIFDLLLVRSW